ncbi:LONRF3 family protein [Megaselia abdita]
MSNKKQQFPLYGNMNLDSYVWYADSLAHCGRISEAFEIYNYINNNVCGHLPLARLKNLSKCLIEYVLRLSKDGENEHKSKFIFVYSDPLMCQICSPPDILRCPVTAKCGHTFCKECCDKTSKCPICNLSFSSSSSLEKKNNENQNQCSNNVQMNTSRTSSTSATTFTTSTATYTFPSTSFVTSTATESTVSSVFSTSSILNNTELNKKKKANTNLLMPDILVRQIVEKWWSEDLYARNMNDLSMQYLKLNLLDEALKFCNESLDKSPNNFHSLLLRAEILYKLQQYQSSLADADRAIKMQLIAPKAFYQKAQALAALGKFEESLISLCLVICLDEKMEIFTTSNFEKNLSTIVQQLFDKDILSVYNKSYKRRKMSSENSNEFQLDILSHSRLKKHFRRKESSKGKHLTDLNIICNISDNYSEKGLQFRNILIKTEEEIRKLKDNIQFSAENKVMKRHVNPKLIDPSDFDCVLCCRTLWKPVVTQCGHTYCWVCLTRCLDYSSFCPLCKSSLTSNENSSSYSNEICLSTKRPTTKFLEVAMQLYIPSVYESRFLQEIELEPSVPVFVCTTAFPCVPCPLFVYEPRYRLMVRRCIESGDRKFGIVQYQHKGTSKYFDVGTLLEIRDCVLLADGCFILSTIGCKRFKIITRNEKDGYETAKIEFIRDGITNYEMMPKLKQIHNVVLKKASEWFNTLKENLKDEIFRTFGNMPHLEENWQASPDGPSWAWWIIAILPLNQQLKVRTLFYHFNFRVVKYVLLFR